MTSITSPCLKCAHFDNYKGLTREAFPDGIPRELMFGYVAHETPYPGDKGIRFAQRVIEGERFEPERYEGWVHYWTSQGDKSELSQRLYDQILERIQQHFPATEQVGET